MERRCRNNVRDRRDFAAVRPIPGHAEVEALNRRRSLGDLLNEARNKPGLAEFASMGGSPETAVISETQYPDYPTLAAVIARSQIVMPRVVMPRAIMQRAAPRPRLPAGFDDTDLAMLEWIAREGRRTAHSFVRI